MHLFAFMSKLSCIHRYKHNQGLKNNAKLCWPNQKFVSDLKSLKVVMKLLTFSQILEELSKHQIS